MDERTQKMDNQVNDQRPEFDEIDIFELFGGLWQQKWLILAITCLTALVSVLGTLAMTPTYRAEAFIRAPLTSQIADIAESGVMEFTPKQAILRVEEELNSLSLRREIFDRNIGSLFDHEPVSEDERNSTFFNEFNPAIRVVAPNRGPKLKNEDRRTLSFEHSSPTATATILNELNTAASAAAKFNLLIEFKSTVSLRLANLRKELQQGVVNQATADKDTIARLSEQDRLIKLQLEDEIAAVRAMAAKEREDEITRLHEALSVAKSLDIIEPTSLAVMSQDKSNITGSVAFTAEISEGDDPIYLKGTRVLGAELNALKERSSDDQHIAGLRKLEKDLDLLETNRQIEILEARENFEPFVPNAQKLREEISNLEELLTQDYADISLVRVDQAAMVPVAPSKPRKSLILAAAVIAGGMLGVVIALIRNAAAARRERLAAS